MHLKSLTLKGFKSFASATTLRFEPGITCVVGPNGSGKSNVVDALTWVMGEQGAKALRGGKMQDVIFAGTTGRAALGRAEVTLTIDNSDGALPIDYAEVSITRRMFRDGAGEYEINGSSCRLMDVQELLSDSGIGREMHVIVGQGQLSAILESRPEDRRAFIEEAAGVLKHRKRKEKAVRKLTAMQANLARLTDLTTELRRQLKPLGRQAEVARRAQTVQADLRDARLRLAADDLVARRTELASQNSKEAYAREQQITVQTELDAAGAVLAQQEFTLSQLTPAAEAAAQQWFNLSTLAERVNATVRIASDRARHLDTSPATSSGRDPEYLEAEADRVEAQEAELRDIAEAAEETLSQAAEALADREQVAQAAERAHLSAVRAIADQREGVARLAGQVDTLAARVQSVDSDIARITQEITAAADRAETAQVEFDTVQGELGDLDVSEQELDAQYEHAHAAYQLADQRVTELREQDREASTSVAGLTARIDALASNLSRRDGSAWLNAHHSADLLAPLSTQIRIHPGFEAAVAAVLGPLSDAIIARCSDAAFQAMGALRAADAGRGALVFPPISSPDQHAETSAPEYQQVQTPQNPPNSGQWLATVVDCAAPVQAAVTALTNQVVVVDDMTAAEQLLPDRDDIRIVTRAGDLVGPGWVVGGSARIPSPLEIQADIDTAQEELTATHRRAEEVAAALTGALAEQTERKAAVDQALLALHESDQAFEALYERLARLGHLAQAATADHARLNQQLVHAESTHADTRAALTEATERLYRAEQDSGNDTGLSAAETESADLAREEAAAALADARSLEMESRLALRSAQEQVTSMRGKADGLRRAAQAERHERARAEQALAARRQAAEVAATVARSGTAIAEALTEVVAKAAARRDDLVRRREECTSQREHLQERVRGLTGQLNQLTDAVHRDEVAKAQAALRIEQLEATITEQFAMAPADLIAEYGPEVPLPPSALEWQEYEQARARGELVTEPTPLPFDRASQERRAKRAEKDLATLGKVNPLALEEFAALEERYNFLATQLEDVQNTRKSLLEVIDEVDARILQVFTDAYEDVAREFVQVFATLFPGGEGRLRLTDPADMLATGIEVEARPPGKKVKRLSLLSGGEKSLTAVALLVAIFRARPSPFYVMDEVEAALDDTNLRRLITLFAQLREKSQLIVITHQKPTMEVADALYGVSMRGDGITQVISQRLVPT